MHILVTGGAGYVGSRLVPALLEAGHTVTVLDWFFFEPRQFVEPVPGLTCIVGDLRDREKVKEALDHADAVIHLAAISNDPTCELNPSVTWDINFEASCRLADLAQQAGVRRFINASSASVYGIKEEERVTEELPSSPETIYGRSKAESEAYILAANNKRFTTTSVRPATLSGYAPRMRLDLTVNILTYQAICKNLLQVFGGSQYRPNLALNDMVRAYLLLLTIAAEKVAGRTFNLSEGNYRVLGIAEEIKRVLGLEDLEIRRVPTKDTRSYRLCADRAAQELGFTASLNLEHSIRDVATAFIDGRIFDPDQPRYRNIEWLKGQNFPNRMPVTTL